jgi:hypothetical protein
VFTDTKNTLKWQQLMRCDKWCDRREKLENIDRANNGGLINCGSAGKVSRDKSTAPISRY